MHVTGSGVRSSGSAPSRLVLGFRGVSGPRRQHEPRRRDDGSYRPPPVVDWCFPGGRRRSSQRRWWRRTLDALGESSRAAGGRARCARHWKRRAVERLRAVTARAGGPRGEWPPRQHEPRRRDDGSYRPPPVVDLRLHGLRPRSSQRRWSRWKLNALGNSRRATAARASQGEGRAWRRADSVECCLPQCSSGTGSAACSLYWVETRQSHLTMRQKLQLRL